MIAFTDTDDDFVIVHKVKLHDLLNCSTYIDKTFFDNETMTQNANYITHLGYDIVRSNYSIDHLPIHCVRQFKFLKNWKYMAKIMNQGAFALPCKILQSKLDEDTYIGELKTPSSMKININSHNNTAILRKCLRVFELYNNEDHTINNVDITIEYGTTSVTVKYCIW